jgi:hypothetical protein
MSFECRDSCFLHAEICAHSYIAEPYREDTQQLPTKAGEWENCDSCYRIELRDFAALETALSVREFLRLRSFAWVADFRFG